MREAGIVGWEMGNGMSAADAIRELARQRDEAMDGAIDLRRRETLRAAAEMLSRVREWASEALASDINAMIDQCNLDAIADGGVGYRDEQGRSVGQRMVQSQPAKPSSPVYRWVPGMRARSLHVGNLGIVLEVDGSWLTVRGGQGLADGCEPDLDLGATRGALLDQVRERPACSEAFVSKYHDRWTVWSHGDDDPDSLGTGPTEGTALMDALTRLASKHSPSNGVATVADDPDMDHAAAVDSRGPWVVQWSRFNDVMAAGYWDESAAAEQVRKIARDGLSPTMRPATADEESHMRRATRGCALHHLQPGAKP
jgi:hypothetical protein